MRANGASRERDALQKLLRDLEMKNEENIKKYKRQVQAAQTEAARAIQNLDAALARQRELESLPVQLKTEIQTLHREIQNLEEGKYGAEIQLQRMQLEKTVLIADKDSLMKELELFRSAAQQHVENDRQGLVLLEHQLAQQEKKCVAMETELEKAQDRERETVKNNEKDRAALETKLAEEMQGNKEHKMRLVESQVQLTSLQAQLETREEELQVLQKSLATLEAQAAAQLGEHKLEVACLEKKLADEETAHRAGVEQKKSELQAHMAAMKTELEKAQDRERETVKNNEKDRAALETKLAEEMQGNKEHKMRLVESQVQLTSLQAQLETREEELQVLQKSLATLEAQAAAQLGEHQLEVACLEKKLADEETAHRAGVEQKKSEFQAHMAAMEDAHQNRLHELEDRLQHQEQAISEANAKLQETNTELQSTQQNLQLNQVLVREDAARTQAEFEGRVLVIQEDSARAVRLAETKLQITLEQGAAEKKLQDDEIDCARQLVRALQDDKHFSQLETQGLYAALDTISLESDSLECTAADFEQSVLMLVGLLQAQTVQGAESVSQLQQKIMTLKDALTIAQNERNKMEQERDSLQHTFAETQKRVERAQQQLQDVLHERAALEQQLSKQQLAADTRAKSQEAEIEHMHSKLNEMFKELEQAQRENIEMARQVHNLSSLVQGEETCRKIIAAQTAAQENAILAMQTQRNDLQGQLAEANRKLSEASAELNRMNWQQAQHLQTAESRAKMQMQQADERYVRACECLCVRDRAQESVSVRVCVWLHVCIHTDTNTYIVCMYTPAHNRTYTHVCMSCPPPTVCLPSKPSVMMMQLCTGCKTWRGRCSTAGSQWRRRKNGLRTLRLGLAAPRVPSTHRQQDGHKS
jgi:chromosome segregation ATPase